MENKKLELSQKIEELTESQRNFEQSQSELAKVISCTRRLLTDQLLETNYLV